ncbi:hypothetical protein M404DRAFT_28277 [Pisolithus tinctorius Marx 270]|uniref:Uncharacterized protein n=1 Tax=Pisolithus tinctorius Marx 270 TaxID=870435 RepID=A0A0C3NM92_PISTI|nr:hypothetical protein M404DRAFT_28277 [Pisolithus tinctorius Marx 270]
MPSQHQSKTSQPTPGHVCDYSQVADEELVILTDDSTNTKREKSMEKVCRQEEAEWREREHEAECKAKRQKVEEEWLEAEQKKRVEEEAQKRRVMEEEAESLSGEGPGHAEFVYFCTTTR